MTNGNNPYIRGVDFRRNRVVVVSCCAPRFLEASGNDNLDYNVNPRARPTTSEWWASCGAAALGIGLVFKLLHSV
jgi:hypothetical protein